MAVVSSNLIADGQAARQDETGAISYTQVYEVIHDDVDDSPGFSIVGGRSSSPDAVPAKGAVYSQGGTTDNGAFALDFRATMPNPGKRNLRHVTVEFRKLENGLTQTRLQEPNPLLWPIEYYIEWVEEQVPLEQAVNLDDLPGINREANTLGPLVNAAGEEFTEPVMTTEFYPILVAVRNFATLNPIIALNNLFHGTTNASTFFGADPGTAKYLMTRSDRQRQIDTTVYYPTETRIAFRGGGWDRFILNRGYHRIGVDPDTGPHLVRMKVRDKDGSETETPSPSPINLTLSGARMPDDQTGIFLRYRELTPANYAQIGIGG